MHPLGKNFRSKAERKQTFHRRPPGRRETKCYLISENRAKTFCRKAITDAKKSALGVVAAAGTGREVRERETLWVHVGQTGP